MVKEKMTLEKLADMMEAGFEHILGKLEKTATKEQVEGIDKRLQELEDKFENVPARLKTVEEALEI